MGRGKKPLSGRWTVVSPTNRFASVPFANVLCRSTKKRNERCSCLCFVLSAMIQKSTIGMYIPRYFKHWSQAKAVRELTRQVSRTTSEVSEQDVGETNRRRNDRKPVGLSFPFPVSLMRFVLFPLTTKRPLRRAEGPTVFQCQDFDLTPALNEASHIIISCRLQIESVIIICCH